MPNLFDGYCYGTIQEAANAEIALPTQAAASGIVSATSFTATSATSGNMTFAYKTFSSTAQANFVHSKNYPSCASVGYLTNYSGIELADAVSVSWLVVLAWSLAYGIKILRRAL